MKNVLLTTSALVAFAGAAAAEAHLGVSFSGSAEIKYNDITEFSYGADLTVTGTAELNNGITATLSYGINLDDHGSINGDHFPVLTLENSYGKLSAGDADAIGPASDHFSETDGVSGFSDGYYTEDEFTIRLDMTLGGFNASISESDFGHNSLNDMRVGASGSFGNFDFGLGYADDLDEVGVNVGTTFGGFDVDFSVFDSAADGIDYGIQVGYAINSMITVGAYFASVDDASAQNYGVSLDYANGPLTVGLGYDSEAGTGNAFVDVEYALAGASSGVVLFAGYDQAGGGYVGVEYDLGSGAKAWASYAEFDEAGGPEFDEGITVGLSVEF